VVIVLCDDRDCFLFVDGNSITFSLVLVPRLFFVPFSTVDSVYNLFVAVVLLSSWICLQYYYFYNDESCVHEPLTCLDGRSSSHRISIVDEWNERSLNKGGANFGSM
jgi:hypothetical protein